MSEKASPGCAQSRLGERKAVVCCPFESVPARWLVAAHSAARPAMRRWRTEVDGEARDAYAGAEEAMRECACSVTEVLHRRLPLIALSPPPPSRRRPSTLPTILPIMRGMPISNR